MCEISILTVDAFDLSFLHLVAKTFEAMKFQTKSIEFFKNSFCFFLPQAINYQLFRTKVDGNLYLIYLM